MTGFELQRKNMVESQVRPSDITDRRIIRAMQALPREIFAAEDAKALAYMDEELAVGPPTPGRLRRTLLAPRVLARLIQALEVDPADRALEIGAASGYGAAVLGHLAKSVIALDSDPALTREAQAALAEVGAGQVKAVTGPLASGWPEEAPYGAILVSGAIPELPPALLDQLRDGGRLAAVVTKGAVGRLTIWRRSGGTYAARTVGEANAQALPGIERATGFVF